MNSIHTCETQDGQQRYHKHDELKLENNATQTRYLIFNFMINSLPYLCAAHVNDTCVKHGIDKFKLFCDKQEN